MEPNKAAAQAERLVASLEDFLREWTQPETRGGRSEHISAVASTAASACAYLQHLPPPLPAPLPRSFRPHEIVPGVYLGSWSDMGTDMIDLAQRLRAASTATAPPRLASHTPQRLVLLVRVCPLEGVAAPRLELRAATQPRGVVRRTHPSVVRATAPLSGGPRQTGLPVWQPPRRPSCAAPVADRPSITATTKTTKAAAATSDDALLWHTSLDDLYTQVCAAAAGAAGVPHANGGAVARWLCPDPPLSSSSPRPPRRATAAAVPPGCTTADPHVFVRAVQDILVATPPTASADARGGGHGAAAAAAAAAAEAAVSPACPPSLLYWRLVLPVLDSPETCLYRLLPMTSLLLRAAVTLHQHPRGPAWLAQGQPPQQHTSNSSSGGTDAGDADGATVADGAVAVGPGTPSLFPCAGVHCQAGKSRSVTVVAAFLLQEWMWWCRDQPTVPTAAAAAAPTTTLPPPSPRSPSHSSSSASLSPEPQQQQQQQLQQQQRRQSGTARRLVDTVLAHIRRRRLCIDVNVGFDTQLWEMTGAFVRSVVT
ncbi:Dual specificity phosphatase, catalytic domain containing protein [Novymonas esmeraldas]|uniref:Dual specificity phosphatase, catalytic domain containing protein n=1 Tax=Novymonas esmeraldas TaxID=1808958 RepID=A0AAW0EXK7_9TRYP